MTSMLVAGSAAFRTMVVPAAAKGSHDCRPIAGVEADRRDPRVIETVRKEGRAGGHRVGDDELLEHRLLREF